MELTQIGKVQSCYPEKFGTPRQSGLVSESRGFLEIFPQFQPEISLQGLEGFSHVWVLFGFHRNKTARFHSKVHPPRLGGNSIGFFATRTPHRPNPIGMSVVKIEKVESQGLWVSGIDFVDETPFYDLKPYIQEDRIENPRLGWTSFSPPVAPEIQWHPEAQQKLLANPDFNVALLESTLKLDPRPLVYRGFEGAEESQTPYRSEHSVRLGCWDVHFKFLNENLIEVKNFNLWQGPQTSRSNDGKLKSSPHL